MLDPTTASHSLAETLGLGAVPVREVYAALDWFGSEQSFIENIVVRRHLKEGARVPYDVTSTYLERRHCELARHGYCRDDRPQLVIGLLCAADGCPVAVEVFEGNTADPATQVSQIGKSKDRFNLKRVVLVGDRGKITDARIEQTLRPAGLDWITALRTPAIRDLASGGGPLRPSLFDDRDPRLRKGMCGRPLGCKRKIEKSDNRVDSGHVSGLLARQHGRWPRWDPRSSPKQACGFESRSPRRVLQIVGSTDGHLVLLSHPGIDAWFGR